jgi:hypothetical protein
MYYLQQGKRELRQGPTGAEFQQPEVVGAVYVRQLDWISFVSHVPCGMDNLNSLCWYIVALNVRTQKGK